MPCPFRNVPAEHGDCLRIDLPRPQRGRGLNKERTEEAEVQFIAGRYTEYIR